MMSRVVCLFSIGIALASRCFGNVGESEAAIAERYGKSFGQIPTNTFGVVTGFMFTTPTPGVQTATTYIVGVKFIDGTSEMEMFAKSDRSDMPASEIDRLLKKNSPGEWKAELTGKPNWRRWRRDDGTAVALYDAARHFLYVNSKAFYEIKGQQIEQQEWKHGENVQVPVATPPAVSTLMSSATPAPTSTPQQ